MRACPIPSEHRSVVGNRLPYDTLPSLSAFKSMPRIDRTHGDSYYCTGSGERWWWHSTSTLTPDGLFAVAPDVGYGRWLKTCGVCDLALPIDYTLVNNATLLAVPVGARLKLLGTYLEVTEAFHGSGNPSASLSGTAAGMASPGSVAGGAAGETISSLTVGIRPGTIGTSLGTVQGLHDAMFTAGDEIRWRRSGGNLTAGRGFWHLTVNLLTHPGA